MTPEHIWAKPPRYGLTLLQHTKDVVEAGESLFGTPDAPTRLGESWLRFFRLDVQNDWTRFHGNLLAACLFHDWGKANQGMQDVLEGKGSQLFRHEHLSVLIMAYSGVDRWLRQRSDIDWDIVLAAVGSHHLKFSDSEFAQERANETTRVWWAHPEMRALVDSTSTRLELSGSPEFPAQEFWGFANVATFNPTELRDHLRNTRLRKLSVATRDRDQPRARMLCAVRAALIAADGAASGLRRTRQTITAWVNERFEDDQLCDFAFIQQIIDNRVNDLSKQSKWAQWNDFQNACDDLPARTLLLAPCGAGKTLAAWRWIAAQAKQRPVKRVLFLYPTRATATEGFKDYVSWAPEDVAALLHGTASYDLDGMFTAEDPRTGKMFNGTDPRLFAIRHWSKQVFSATIDQFFGFLSYGYGPLCLLPLLSDCILVVDEVHSFDRAMFSALLSFLAAFDVPVLCMTATMQSGRKQQLAELMDKVYDERPNDLARIATAPRYKVSRVEAQHAEAIARRSIAEGKRVLWVVNQVSRAQAVAAALSDLDVPVICYHSRFKLDDRVTRHQETVKAIRAAEPAAIVIATQVCEMSLDIDADVLITEECPITSLIQRMGRCRRGRGELESKGPGEVFIYRPEVENVYAAEDLEGLEAFLACLAVQPSVSQADLEKGLEDFGAQAIESLKTSSFLASGAYAMAGEDSFRDIDAFSLQSILNDELELYLSAPKERQPGFVVPVPRKLRPTTDSRLPGYLHVADQRHYDAQTGYWDTPRR